MVAITRAQHPTTNADGLFKSTSICGRTQGSVKLLNLDNI